MRNCHRRQGIHGSHAPRRNRLLNASDEEQGALIQIKKRSVLVHSSVDGDWTPCLEYRSESRA
jgi:hypothetical protein